MKKSLSFALAFTLFAFIGNIALAQTFNYPVKGKQGFALTEKTRSGLHISYNLGQMSLSQLNYRGEDMSEITISAIALPNNAGCPNLPTESRMMAIPQGATASLRVVSFEKETLHNVNIAPALRIQLIYLCFVVVMAHAAIDAQQAEGALHCIGHVGACQCQVVQQRCVFVGYAVSRRACIVIVLD